MADDNTIVSVSVHNPLQTIFLQTTDGSNAIRINGLKRVHGETEPHEKRGRNVATKFNWRGFDMQHTRCMVEIQKTHYALP